MLRFNLTRIRRLRQEKAYREARRVTQDEVAAYCGVHRNTISRYETGAYTDPEPAVISKIAEFFDVPYGYFLEEVEDNDNTLPKPRYDKVAIPLYR
jgi:transcriptional regulator with XRE-family HTH domain